ncbi:MAG: hypothetical protein AABY15_00355 [Nanoarchaeota archaeon]
MKHLSQNSETIATISWLLMDFCWTSEYMIAAWVFSMLALSFSIIALLFYDGEKKSEKYILIASLSWVTMNSLWMYGDDLKIDWMSMVAKLFFIVAAVFIVISIKEAKKEGKPIDLKRLKIK